MAVARTGMGAEGVLQDSHPHPPEVSLPDLLNKLPAADR
jgi:hypothetical protein